MCHYFDEVLSYFAGIFAMFMSHVHCMTPGDVYSTLMAAGSALLLCSRLAVDVPRAYRAWKNRRK